MIYRWQQADLASKASVYTCTLCSFQSFSKWHLSLSILKGHYKCPIKIFMLLTWQEAMCYRKKFSGMELFIIAHVSCGPCPGKIMMVERFRFKLAAPRTAGSVLRRETITIYGVSLTFPNILSDNKHQNPPSKATSFSCYYLEEKR